MEAEKNHLVPPKLQQRQGQHHAEHRRAVMVEVLRNDPQVICEMRRFLGMGLGSPLETGGARVALSGDDAVGRLGFIRLALAGLYGWQLTRQSGSPLSPAERRTW